MRLRAVEEPFRNEEICVLHPIESVQPDEIPLLDLLRPGRVARFQLLMDAIRLIRALELPRPRLLIADDVGLGKTIEAGLILRELHARRRAARILIVSPASINEQWQTELASTFGFEFRIFDSEGVAGDRVVALRFTSISRPAASRARVRHLAHVSSRTLNWLNRMKGHGTKFAPKTGRGDR